MTFEELKEFFDNTLNGEYSYEVLEDGNDD